MDIFNLPSVIIFEINCELFYQVNDFGGGTITDSAPIF